MEDKHLEKEDRNKGREYIDEKEHGRGRTLLEREPYEMEERSLCSL